MGHFWTTTALLAALAQGQDPHAHHRPAPTVVEGGWVKYHHKTANFSVEHPPDWSVVSEKQVISIHIVHPTKPVHLFLSAFIMQGGTLGEFAELKFGAQPEIFKPLGPARAIEGVGWSGLVQEAETAANGERVRRRILCAQHEDLYVSLALYTDAKDLAAPDEDYERIFGSLRFDAGVSAPVSSPAQSH